MSLSAKLAVFNNSSRTSRCMCFGSGCSWGAEHALWCLVGLALWRGQGWLCVGGEPCPITWWLLEESKVDMLLWKIRKPKTWWNPDVIIQYDAERWKTVAWLNSTRLLTSLDHSEFILAWDWRILFKLLCEKYVQGKIYHGWSWQGSCASLMFIKLFIVKYSCLKISVS